VTSAPCIYDPRVGHWTFDTSSLRNLDDGKLAGSLVVNFKGRAHLVSEVMQELPSTSVLRSPLFPWFDVESVTLPAEQALFSLLRQRWGSAPGKDRGEAAAIVLAARGGYRFVCDDSTGFRAAESQEARVCTMRTPSLVVAMVRVGWILPDDGWTAIQDVLAAGNWLNIPWADRTEYDALCAIPGFDPCRFDAPEVDEPRPEGG
jgi:predicted nucleic acid-binding protein